MIRRWSSTFRAAGFDDYAIDFSDIDADLIERLGRTVQRWLQEKNLQCGNESLTDGSVPFPDPPD